MAAAGSDPGRGIMAAEQEAEETVPQERHSPSELRIVLLGKTGAGKSTAGNTILDTEEGGSGFITSVVTKECEKRTGEVSGRRVTVVDTPDLLDTDRIKIERCVSLSAPGPHAFLLAIPVYPKGSGHAQFWKAVSKGHCKSLDEVQELFGERAVRNTMILFTFWDLLEGRTIEQHIEEAGEELQQLVEKCGNRYHVLNNKDRSDRTQVTQLLDKIDNMVKGSGGCFLPNEIYQELEERIRQKEQELNEKHKEELSRKEEEMKQKYEEEQRRREEELIEKFRKQMKEEKLEKEAEESKLPVRRRNSIEGDRPNLSGGEGEAPLADTQAPPSPPELRMVLLGKTGAGKSAAGNTSSSAVTRECEKRKGQVAGRRVAVIDTPELSLDKLQIRSCVSLSALGPHDKSCYTSEGKERAGDVRIGKKRDEQIERVGYEKSKLLKERPGELELQLELRRERERSRVLERELKRAQEGKQELKKEREKRRELEEELERRREREKSRVLERELKRAQEGKQELKKERERSRVLERELKRAQEVEQELKKEREKRRELEEEQRREREKRRELERELRRAQEGEQEVKKEREKRRELEEELELRREKFRVLERELKRAQEGEQEVKKEREKRREPEEEQEWRRKSVKSRVLDWELKKEKEREEREKAELKREKGSKQRTPKMIVKF